MKKFPIFIVCLLLFCLIITPVSANSDTQCFDLKELDDNTLAFTATNSPTFWEKPTLVAGQYSLVTGTLTVKNSTTSEQKIGLRTVELPYDNEDALRYLNHVYLTVRGNGETLYEGPYSRINDDRDFTLNTVLDTNESVSYSIDLQCDYKYVGNGLSANDMIKWEFYAVPEVTENAADSLSFSNPAFIEVLVACGIAALLLGGIFLYDRFRRKHQ